MPTTNTTRSSYKSSEKMGSRMGSRTKGRVASWDDAIADFRQRIKDLKKAIRVFQEQKRRGESFAGESATQN
jgi:hypothetical protein